MLNLCGFWAVLRILQISLAQTANLPHYLDIRQRAGLPSEEKMAYQMHLNKSGSGFASKTACGRNILRTPMSSNWEKFKNEPEEYKCLKCKTSKQAEVNARMDARKQ
jgi:hypothetical protein